MFGSAACSGNPFGVLLVDRDARAFKPRPGVIDSTRWVTPWQCNGPKAW